MPHTPPIYENVPLPSIVSSISSCKLSGCPKYNNNNAKSIQSLIVSHQAIVIHLVLLSLHSPGPTARHSDMIFLSVTTIFLLGIHFNYWLIFIHYSGPVKPFRQSENMVMRIVRTTSGKARS